jgi:hypothetical protein
MLMIRPQAITDAALASSNVPETLASWSSTTIYALGAQVMTASHRVYESLSGGTSSTVTMTIASPCVVSWTAHGLAANTPILFTTTGALPTGLVAGTVYYVLSPTANNFNVSAAPGGAAINTSGTQSGTHTATANPNKNKAVTDPAFWHDIGPTNRWAMFDNVNGTVTRDAALIDVTVNLTGRVDSVALVNLANAVTARIIVSTVADGTLYDQTFSLVSSDGIGDWYDYFFEEIDHKSKLLITGLPVYANPSLRMVLTGNGTAPVECGTFVVGMSKDLGETLHDGAQVGIHDYSRKEADAFGNSILVERAFADIGSFKTVALKSQVDGIRKALAAMRATPAVYSGSAEYDATLIFGWFKDFNVEIEYPLTSLLSIELEGLT